jgi:hypothetical protein
MKQEFIIADASIKYMNARNPLEESLFYAGTVNWTRKLEEAIKYESTSHAIKEAIVLRQDAPVKIFMLQTDGARVGFAEIKF